MGLWGLLDQHGRAPRRSSGFSWLLSPPSSFGSVRALALKGDRIGVLQQDGNTFVKEGPLNAPWTWESGSVQAFALERYGIP